MRLLFSMLQFRNSEVREFLLIRGLFLFFISLLYSAAYCRVLANVCEAKLRFCVIHESLFNGLY